MADPQFPMRPATDHGRSAPLAGAPYAGSPYAGGPLAAGAPPAAIQTRAPTAAPAKRQAGNDNRFVALMTEGGKSLAKFEDFLPDTEAISERRHSPFASILIWALCGLVVAAILWMSLSKVDEVASAPGIVRPSGKVKLVNHTDGGRVAQILVKEGELVKEGQDLVILDGDLVDQEISKVAAQHRALVVETARLEAETADAPLTFPSDVGLSAEEIANQTALYKSRMAEIGSRRAAAEQVAQQQQTRVGALKQRIPSLEKSATVLEDQYNRLATLARDGNFPWLRVMSVERDLITAKQDLEQARRDLSQTEQALAEAVERRALIDREWNSANFKRLGEARAERDRLAAALQQQRQLKRNLSLKAPVDGIVNGLKVVNPGQAIRPGEPVVGVVPAGEARRIEVEARVGNADIGVITLDQSASVKFQAYDWIRYGVLPGKVTHIAADATQPDPSMGQGAQPYFSVVISVDRDWVGDETSKVRVTPGMAATVDLNTGTRTIIGYFLDRIWKTAQGSMRERSM